MKELLINIIKNQGKKHPKKHGEWYLINVYDNNFLLYDTWNECIYHYPDGAKPNDTNNMYNCVYVFYDSKGSSVNYNRVKGIMYNFWYAHLCHLIFTTK